VAGRELLVLLAACASPPRIAADADCIEGVPKGSPDGTRILL